MAKFIKVEGNDTVYVTDSIFYWTVRSNQHLQELVGAGLVPSGSATVSPGLFSRLTEAHSSAVAGGGLSTAQARQIVRQEINKTKLTA